MDGMDCQRNLQYGVTHTTLMKQKLHATFMVQKLLDEFVQTFRCKIWQSHGTLSFRVLPHPPPDTVLLCASRQTWLLEAVWCVLPLALDAHARVPYDGQICTLISHCVPGGRPACWKRWCNVAMRVRCARAHSP